MQIYLSVNDSQNFATQSLYLFFRATKDSKNQSDLQKWECYVNAFNFAFSFIIICMKLVCVFLLIVLAFVAKAQLLPSTWQIVTEDNSQTIWNKLGLKQMGGRCRWKWPDQLIVKMYWQNVWDNYLEITIYVNKSHISNSPFFSGQVNATCKLYLNGIKQAYYNLNQPFITLSIQTLQVKQVGNTLKIQFQQQKDAILVSILLVIQQVLKLIVFMIFALEMDEISRQAKMKKLYPNSSQSRISTQSPLFQKSSVLYLSALNAWELSFTLFLFLDQRQHLQDYAFFLLLLMVFHFLSQAILFLVLIACKPEYKRLTYAAVYCSIWFFGCFLSLEGNLFLLSLFPLIQIQQNYLKDQKYSISALALLYYIINLAVGIYIIGCPVNILRHRTNYTLVVLIIALAIIQILILEFQERLGSRFWLKGGCEAKQKLDMEQKSLMNAECPHCFNSLTIKAILATDKQDSQKMKRI